jgi:hypothetical protein
MANLNIKINLQNLICACRFEKGTSGLVECLIIPLEKNHLFKGEKGVYLDLTAFELKERKENKTHLIKQQLPKDVFKAMTDEQKKNTPILGDVSVWEHTEPDPVSDLTPLNEGDKLPWE